MSASSAWSTHPARRIINREELLKLLLMGFTLRECCAQLKVSYAALCRRSKEPEFLLLIKEHSGEIAKRLVEELSTSQVEMAQKLEEASSAALEEMMVMMTSLEGASGLKVKICQDLLDRDPKSSRTKRMDITGNMSHQFINPAVLIHAAATAKEVERFQLGEKNGDNPDNPPNS